MTRLSLALLVLLAACGEMPKMKMPSLNAEDYDAIYRMDIRQGNFVTQEMVAQLKPGQTREQVRFVLGTPLLTDPFHANRWDYVYRYDNGKGDVQQRRLTVYFEDDKLSRVGGDVLPVDPNAAPVAAVPPGEVDIAPALGSEAAKTAPTTAPAHAENK